MYVRDGKRLKFNSQTQTVNVTATSVGEYEFSWNIPEEIGTMLWKLV